MTAEATITDELIPFLLQSNLGFSIQGHIDMQTGGASDRSANLISGCSDVISLIGYWLVDHSTSWATMLN